MVKGELGGQRGVRYQMKEKGASDIRPKRSKRLSQGTKAIKITYKRTKNIQKSISKCVTQTIAQHTNINFCTKDSCIYTKLSNVTIYKVKQCDYIHNYTYQCYINRLLTCQVRNCNTAILIDLCNKISDISN